MANTVHINREKLKQLREQRDLSQEGLEQACRQTQGCSISMTTIKRAELGRRISRRSATKLANFFSLTLNELILEPTNKLLNNPAPDTTSSIMLWFHSSHTHLLHKISERALCFEPYMFQRTNDIITVAFPYQPHSLCALVLQSSLLKLCESCTNYRALVTLEKLSQPIPYQWQMSEQQYLRLSEITDKVPHNTIVVSPDIYKQSHSILNYQSCASISDYQELLQKKAPLSTQRELSMLRDNAIRFAEVYGNDTELIL